MKFSASFLALLVVGAHGFTTSSPYTSKPLMMSDAVAEPEVADEAESQVEAPAAPPAALSGLRVHDVRRAVAKIEKDNFSQTLKDLEPYFLNEAGATIYSKSMRRISVKAKALGVEVPADYAKEAKATQKKREKQNAFIQMKEEERLAAEAAPAEEEATEEEAPAEE